MVEGGNCSIGVPLDDDDVPYGVCFGLFTLALPVPASLLQGGRRREGGYCHLSLLALECGHVGVAVSPDRRRCLVTMENVIKKKK